MSARPCIVFFVVIISCYPCQSRTLRSCFLCTPTPTTHFCWEMAEGAGKAVDFRRTASTCSSFIQIHKNLFLALYDQIQAKAMAIHELNQNYVIIPVHRAALVDFDYRTEIESKPFVPSSLGQVYSFDQMIRGISRKNAGSKLVICTGTEIPVQLRIAFLLGSHLVMTHCYDIEALYSSFEPMNDILSNARENSDVHLSIWSSWRALACAKSMNWLDFWEVFDTGDCASNTHINIEEFLHYARRAPTVSPSPSFDSSSWR